MHVEPGKNLGAQLTNFVRMSQFFIEPLHDDPYDPATILGVVEDLLEHVNKYSLILQAAGYKIDALLHLAATKEV